MSKSKNRIGLYSYDVLESSVEEVWKDANKLAEDSKIEIIAYKNTSVEFDESYTLEVEDQEVWLTISRKYEDSFWKIEVDRGELFDLFSTIKNEGFDVGMDTLFGWNFFAPGKGDNSFEMYLTEYDEENLPENCFVDGEVSAYQIFENYESNLEDTDINDFGNTQRIDIIVGEKYCGSIWSGAY
jgi:hypothetical protein